MPAINPAHLKTHCAEIGHYFTDPQQFIAKLHGLLNFYADRIRRPGEAGTPPPLIPAYHVPAPVLRYLEREITPRVTQYPQAALSLTDALWSEEWLETRLLAAAILGRVPPISPNPILERVQKWGAGCKESLLQKALFTQGISQIREHYQEEFLRVINNLLENPEKDAQREGLYALIPLLEDANFQNLPVVYRMLSNLLKNEETGSQSEIVAVVRALAKRSEQETVFFLQEKLLTAAEPRITRVVRLSLPFFSEKYQKRLKGKLREGRR
ncbi:MAG: DNA alkylation repair protein [Chloroflexota bacterium]|nr:DNA alkylation repair protein [Chloroflexota bacterium]